MSEETLSVRSRVQIIDAVEAKLAGVLGDELDAIVEIFRNVTDITTVQEANCPTCDRKVSVRYPDYKGQKAILEMLLDRVLGKPTQRIETTGKVDVDIHHFAELSEAELLKIAGRAPLRALPPGEEQP